jgi:hypothetical protein
MPADDSTPRQAFDPHADGVWTCWELSGSYFAAEWLSYIFAAFWPGEQLQDGCDAR